MTKHSKTKTKQKSVVNKKKRERELIKRRSLCCCTKTDTVLLNVCACSCVCGIQRNIDWNSEKCVNFVVRVLCAIALNPIRFDSHWHINRQNRSRIRLSHAIVSHKNRNAKKARHTHTLAHRTRIWHDKRAVKIYSAATSNTYKNAWITTVAHDLLNAILFCVCFHSSLVVRVE